VPFGGDPVGEVFIGRLGAMRGMDLYRKILGIGSPWRVSGIELAPTEVPGSVTVTVEAEPGTRQPCPKCSRLCSGYDCRRKEWRHLDTCRRRTIIAAEVPRVDCLEHGVHLADGPWAERGFSFTALFEALAIAWLREASASAVSCRLGLSWSAIDDIMRRAADRGMARRDDGVIRSGIGVDETSFRRHHEYVTVVTDPDRGHVVHVADDRRKESLTAWYDSLTAEQRAGIERVGMDMWSAYITATRGSCHPALTFDRFHVARVLGDAVDRGRWQEHRRLQQQGYTRLTGSGYAWQTSPSRMDGKRKRLFRTLRDSSLQTAWAIRECAMKLWDYVSRTWARKAWKGWAIRSRLEPIRRVALMIMKHLWGIVNAIVLDADNGHAESTNSKIQMLKIRGRGYRSTERFKTVIHFHKILAH